MTGRSPLRRRTSSLGSYRLAAALSIPGPINLWLAGNTLPATQCCVVCGDIWNEKTSFNRFTGNSEKCLCMQTWRQITNLFCQNVLKVATPSPTLGIAFLIILFALLLLVVVAVVVAVVYFYCSWCIVKFFPFVWRFGPYSDHGLPLRGVEITFS